jgi:hypothetical protein
MVAFKDAAVNPLHIKFKTIATNDLSSAALGAP